MRFAIDVGCWNLLYEKSQRASRTNESLNCLLTYLSTNRHAGSQYLLVDVEVWCNILRLDNGNTVDNVSRGNENPTIRCGTTVSLSARISGLSGATCSQTHCYWVCPEAILLLHFFPGDPEVEVKSTWYKNSCATVLFVTRQCECMWHVAMVLWTIVLRMQETHLGWVRQAQWVNPSKRQDGV